jgi:hypothetical protein
MMAEVRNDQCTVLGLSLIELEVLAPGVDTL